MEGILLNPAAWDKAGAFVILIVFVLLIAFGRLLPKSWVETRMKEKDTEIAFLRQTVKELSAVGGTVEDVLVSIRELARRRRDHDDEQADRH